MAALRRSTTIFLCLLTVLSLAPARVALAGLEFCFTPECSDGDPCTCDIKNPDGTCSHDPRSRWAAAARASGIQIDAAGQNVLPPTPDSNVKNPDSVLTLPLAPLAFVEVLKVEEIQENLENNTVSHAKAIVTGGKIRVLDQGAGNWLLSVDSLQAVSESTATNKTATSSTEGTTLNNVVLNGTNLGNIKEPVDFTIQDPILHQRIDVRLLQKLPVGAAAGDPTPDPDFGVMLSGITVNVIRVTVRDVTDPANPKMVADIIIGRADSRVDRFGPNVCTVKNPMVSGRGLVLGIDADETAIDPLRQFARLRIGEVLLPSTGGEDNAELLHVGPLLDPSGRLVLESNAAFSNTAGSVDPAANSAQSNTVTAIEELRALDNGSGAQLAADLVRAECDAAVGQGPPQSHAKTTLVGLKLGDTDICEALSIQDNCSPAPNTELGDDIPGLKILLNEQIPDAPSSGTGITVNAIHIWALGPGNPFGLPLGSEIVVAKAHCDAKPAPGTAPTTDPGSGGTPDTTPAPSKASNPLLDMLPPNLIPSNLGNFLGGNGGLLKLLKLGMPNH